MTHCAHCHTPLMDDNLVVRVVERSSGYQDQRVFCNDDHFYMFLASRLPALEPVLAG